MAIAITFVENPTVDTSETWQCTDTIWASGFGLWIAVGFRSPASVNALQTSPDKTVWTMQALPTNNTRRAVAYSPTLNRAVTVGSTVADWSDDGITWAAATSLPEANNYWDVKWDPVNEVFIAVASSGANRTMWSADGKSWTMVAAAAAKSWQGLQVSTTGAAVAVAFSSSTNTQLVMTSADGGASWSLVTHTAIATNRGLVGGAGRLNIGYSSDLDQFLITGTDAGGVTKAWRSTDDGATWTASNVIPTISDTTARGYFWLSAVQSWYMSCSNLNYGESTDGVTWTVTTFTDPPVSNAGYTPMGWDNDSAILLGGSTLGFDTVLVGQVTELGAVSPSRGTKRGGTVITITGLGLSGVSQDDVLIGGSVALSVSAAADGTSVTCITPAHAVGIVDVEITDIGTLEDAFTYVSIDSVHPRNGPTLGSEAVTIRGFGFDLATTVTFGGTAATNVVIVSNTTITAVTPAHSSGVVDVVVGNVDTGSALYTYQIAFDPLPPIPYRVPPVSPIPHLIVREWVQWFQALKTRVEEPVTITPESIVGGEALTAVNDTNVTLTLTGTPESALLEAVTATLGWTGRLAASRGGTGIGTYAVGDLLYANTTVTLARLADVAAGSYLRSGGVGVAPVWSTLTLPNAATTGDLLYASAANTISNLAAVAAGRVLRAAGVSTAPAYSTFTIPDTFAQGDLIYGSAANTLTALAKDTNATRYLSNTGASNNPAWAQVNLTNGVTGVLPVANGGTGTSTAFTEGSVVFAGPSGTFAQDNANFFWNDTTNALTLGGALNVGGLVTVTGTGTHSFSGAGVSNVLSVGNSTAGTANLSRIILANDLGSRGFFTLLSSTFTSAGINTADGLTIATTGAGGMTIASTNASADINIYTANNIRGKFSRGGNWVFGAAATDPTTGSAVVVFSDAVAPSGMGANTAGVYANDVGGTTHMFAISEADVTIQLTGAANNTLATAVQDLITRLGTIVSGVWNAGAVTSSGAITSTLAAGNALVIDSTTLVADASNNRVGIGTAAPGNTLHVVTGATTATGALFSADGLTSGSTLKVTGSTTGSDSAAGNDAATLYLLGTLAPNETGNPPLTHNVYSGATIKSTAAFASASNAYFLTSVENTTNACEVFGVYSRITDNVALGNILHGMDIDIVSSANAAKTIYGMSGTASAQSNTANTVYGLFYAAVNSGAPTTGTQTTIGALVGAESTGVNGGTANVTGLFVEAGGTVAAGTINIYGVRISNNGASDTTGTSTKYGLYVDTQSGADTNWSLYVNGGTSRLGGSVDLGAKAIKYNDITTAGWGVPAIYGSGRSTAQTAAVASVATYTVGAADGSFVVSANVNVTTSTTHNFTAAVDYTDETNTARTLTLSLSQLAGTIVTAITNGTGAGPYHGVPLHIRCKASTAITVKTTGVFTTVTYNVEATIQQVA